MDRVAAEGSIAGLAARQRGVVTAAQLHTAGFRRAAIKHRLSTGRLHRLHRGVYLVGHPVAPEGAAEMAALLACGRGSVISHRSAAKLWKLRAFIAWDRPVEVTVPGRDPGGKPGLQVHCVAAFDRRDLRHAGNIPTTAPARTLLDLAAVLSFHDLEPSFADARARGLVLDRELTELLDRNRGRRGVRPLRRLFRLGQSGGLTRSEAERRLLALVRLAGLPAPEANALVRGFEVDFLWREQRVVLEVDGFAFHAGKGAFERDRARDATLVASGYTVTRVTWRQLVARPEAVIARIAAALAIRSIAL